MSKLRYDFVCGYAAGVDSIKDTFGFLLIVKIDQSLFYNKINAKIVPIPNNFERLSIGRNYYYVI